MTVHLALLAREVLIDRQSGLPSAINILESIKTESFPVFFPTLTALFVWKRAPDEEDIHEAEVRVTNNESDVTHQAVTVNFHGQPFVRQVFAFKGLMVKAAGNLVISMRMSGETASAVLLIDPREPPAVETAAESGKVITVDA